MFPRRRPYWEEANVDPDFDAISPGALAKMISRIKTGAIGMEQIAVTIPEPIGGEMGEKAIERLEAAAKKIEADQEKHASAPAWMIERNKSWDRELRRRQAKERREEETAHHKSWHHGRSKDWINSLQKSMTITLIEEEGMERLDIVFGRQMILKNGADLARLILFMEMNRQWDQDEYSRDIVLEIHRDAYEEIK